MERVETARGRMIAAMALVSVGLVGALAGAPARGLPAIGLSFTGTTSFDGGSRPPDTMGAVSPEYIVELNNNDFAVYRKSDGAQVARRSLFGFWQDSGVQPKSRAFDPRLLYDAGSERWFAVSVDASNQTNNFMVAVSESSDPTGGWSGFQIASDPVDRNTWADFPMLGITNDRLVVTANMFDFTDRNTFQSDLLVIPKSDLLAPVPTAANATLFVKQAGADVGFNPQPVVDVVGARDDAILLGNVGVLSVAIRSDLFGPAASPTLSDRVAIGIPGSVVAPLSPQPNGAFGLEASSGDNNIDTNVVLLGGEIWATLPEAANDLPAVRWLRIDAATNTLIESGLISDTEVGFLYPSIAVNENGDVVVGFSGSGESQFASAYVVVGRTRNGVTTFGKPMLLKEGAGTYEGVFDGRNRWGDYSATVVDPDDPRTFWTFQEFALQRDEWGVQISQIFVGPEPLGLPALALVLALACRARRHRL